MRGFAPDAHNATAFPLVVQTLLGLLPLAPFDVLVVDPALPPWLPDIIGHDLRVGQATVTLRCWRDDDGGAHWEVLRKRGTLRILRQPPPESLSAGFIERLRGVAESVTP